MIQMYNYLHMSIGLHALLQVHERARGAPAETLAPPMKRDKAQRHERVANVNYVLAVVACAPDA